MTRIALAALLLALSFAHASHAAAQARGNGSKWCMQYRGWGWGGASPDCSYPSRRACMATAAGNVGTCMRNPWYRGR